MTHHVIETLYAGASAPLDERGTLSAIRKSAAPAPWQITWEGLAGDEQADRVHHGGREKALHLYPRDHYATWERELPGIKPDLLIPAAFGENISIGGITEKDACIGDVFRAGTAVLQISQGRQPCFKLNARFGEKRMAFLVQKTGRTGWYYRVLEPGTIAPGDAFALIERPRPEWTLTRVTELLYVKTLALDDLASLADVSELAEGWRNLVRRRIEQRAVESWAQRLEGDL